MLAARLPLLALLFTATLASEAQAGAKPGSATPADTPTGKTSAARRGDVEAVTPAPPRRGSAQAAPSAPPRRDTRPVTSPASVRPAPADAKTTPATSATPTKRRADRDKAAKTPAATPVPKDSLAAAPAKKPAARPLHPRREPLLARHPAATCALDPLEAVGLHQHARARESLREFYWSDMARFFETSVDLAEPVPHHVPDLAFLTTEQVLRDLPAAVRTQLASIAAARVVDRLGERELSKVGKLLASLAPAQVVGLLRADAPTLRAYVWTWLATTRAGGCHLGHLDLDFIDAAVADRSLAVEHGDDLVYRSLGDYALAARARLATLDPARFDSFLARLTDAAEVDPLVRAAAHGVLLRRGHWDTQTRGLRDTSPSVRAATAAAAIEMNRDRVESTVLEHAASDPADLVTELIVGALLGVYDPHNHGRPQVRGALASARDERLAATVARWRGHGDPLEPLPAPQRPLRFSDGPVPKDMPAEPTRPGEPATQPVPEDTSPTIARDTRTTATTSLAAPVPADSKPSRAAARRSASTRASSDGEPALPGILDEPDGAPQTRP